MPVASQAAYQSLQAYKPRSASDTVGEAEQKYDVGGYRSRAGNIRGLVSNLENAVEAVDPSVTGRTTGNFTTEGQRQALVSRERAPILGDLSKQQQALGVQEAGLNQAAGLASNYASVLFNQDQGNYQRLLDQYNASVASEKEAEAQRQFEAQMTLQREQMAAQERQQAAATKAASSSGAGNYMQEIMRAMSTPQVSQAAASTVNNTRDADAQYLGRLMSEDPASRLQLIASLRKAAKAGNAESARKFELGKQLGYWKF